MSRRTGGHKKLGRTATAAGLVIAACVWLAASANHASGWWTAGAILLAGVAVFL